MTGRFVLGAIVAMSALAAPAHAGEQILFAPPAEWVEPRAAKIPAPTSGTATDMPVRTLLSDYQMLLEPNRQSTYVAVSLTFLNPQGLQAGNLSLAWSPDTDELTVHKVAIRRDGKTIDVLAEGQMFDVLRREQSLERATLDGVLTANMFPAGLEVGDTLEFAYTVTTSHPVLAGHAESIVSLNGMFDEAHVRLMWPQAVPMKLAQTRGLPQWKRSLDGGFEIAELSMKAVEPIAPPKGAPFRFSMIRMVEASDFAAWSDVSKLFVPLYRDASRIPADGRLREELETIRKATSDPVTRAEMALRLVQDKVRYVALAMGTGGLVPATAETTWSRRYGDCKAKTALLLGLLQELGITAEPVLVNTLFGDAVAQRLPMVGMFNHVIVRVEIGGREYWLDGTRSNDGSLAGLRIPGFGSVLPVRETGAELVTLAPEPLTIPDEDLAIRIDASAGLYAPAPTEIELLLRGDNAVGTNAALSALGGAGRDKALAEFWQNRFDFISAEKTGMEFDPKAGTLRLTLSGKAEMDWDDGYYETDNMRVGYRPDFARDPGPDSDAPFANAHPFFDRTVQTIILPKGFDADDIDGDPVDATVAGIEYKRQASIVDNVFTATRSTRSVATEFSAAEARKAAQTLEALADMRLFIDVPDGVGPSAKDLDFVMARDLQGMQELIDRGVMLLNANRVTESIADFDRAIALDDSNAWAWANRSIAEINLSKIDEAAQSATRALELDPNNFVGLRASGMVALHKGEHDKAIELFTRSLAEEPGESFTLFQRALAHSSKSQFETALADADRAIELTPSYQQAHMLRTQLLMQLQRTDEAAKSIDTMLALFPDDPGIKTMASELHFAIGNDATSDALLSSAISGGEAPMALVSRAMRRPVDETDEKLADLNQALKLQPDFVPALVARAQTLWMEYRYDAALADANKAIQLMPAAVQAYDIKAKILAERGRRTQAATVADELVKANPNLPAAYMFAAQIYRNLEMPSKAKEMLDREIAAGATSAQSLLQRSQMRALDDVAGRMEDVTAALSIEPDSRPALYMLGGLQMERREFLAAAETFGKISAQAPAEPGPLNMQAIALHKGGRLDDAQKLFDAARAKASAADALNNICFEKVMAGIALERALDECNASLKEHPDFPPTLDSRAMVYLRMGRLQEAIADFDRVLAQSEIASSLFGRAIARALSGDVAGARKDADAARRLAPQMEDIFRRWEIEIPAAIASVPPPMARQTT
jgi:tetratricopeptide (TPR) repeat protein